MTNYTPDELAMRCAHKFHVRALDSAQCGAPGHEPMTDEAITAEFDRFIGKVKADAVREAQANVRASSFWADGSDNYADRVRGFLGSEADRIEREGER